MLWWIEKDSLSKYLRPKEGKKVSHVEIVGKNSRHKEQKEEDSYMESVWLEQSTVHY